MRINTYNDPPPIPGWQKHRWSAVDDSAEGEPVGRGASEAAAVADLLDLLGIEARAITWVSGGAEVEMKECPT